MSIDSIVKKWKKILNGEAGKEIAEKSAKDLAVDVVNDNVEDLYKLRSYKKSLDF